MSNQSLVSKNKKKSLIFNIFFVSLVWFLFLIFTIFSFLFSLFGYNWLIYCVLLNILSVVCFFLTKNIVKYEFFDKKKVIGFLLTPLFVWLILSSYFWYEFSNLDLIGGKNIFM